MMRIASLAVLLVCSAHARELQNAALEPTAQLSELDAVRAVRQSEVDRLNAQQGMTWTAGVNERFRDLPLGASRSLCGVKNGTVERFAARVRAGTMTVMRRDERVSIPTSFDSEENWPHCKKVIGDIRDQSACGCCWAFGGAEAASDRLCIASNGSISLPLSAQEACFCAEEDGCQGGMLDTVWDYIQQSGLVSGGQVNTSGPFSDLGLCSAFSLPHCHHHGPQGSDPYPDENTKGCPTVASGESPSCPSACDDDAKPPYNDFTKARYSFTGSIQTFDGEADTIAQAIMTHGPVEAAFTVYSDFENYVSGVYHTTSDQQMGGHAIRIVGWGEDNGVPYWKVANSWNPYWGESGYFRIRRGTNECGIEEQVIANSGDTWNGPGLKPHPPAPPTPGNCIGQDSQAQCLSTSKGGEVCEWCVLKGLGIGICQDPNTPC